MTRRPCVRIFAILPLAMGLTLAHAAASSAQNAAPGTAPAVTTPVMDGPVPIATPAAATALSTALPTPAATPATDAPSPGSADLSVRALVTHADPIVKGVIALLSIASVLTWTILLAKGVELWRACRGIDRSLRMAEADTTGNTPMPPRPLQLMRKAVSMELAASAVSSIEGTKERLHTRLRRLEMRLTRRIQRGQGVLATIGAVSPFIGLFGTVWGIMNSFVGIAKLHTTNLSVVAPGIAEALLATAAGLVAAIPAVVIYNIFARWMGAYRHGLGDLGEIVLRHASRSLDRGEARPGRTRPVAAE